MAKNATASKKVTTFLKNWISLVGIALLIIIFSICSYVKFDAQYFLTWNNWKTILLQTSTVAIVALGQSIMLLTGNFDLSLGRMVCLTSCVGAVLMKNLGMPVFPALLIMFAIGILIGCLNGFLVSYVGVPAMIATLGSQYICYGVAKLITQAVPIPKMPESLSWLG
ncbi:MAG: ABC transporter permease, partial [Firmicutes bacterium]|nr:ABC transporter permease [Bacillota bacterium]